MSHSVKLVLAGILYAVMMYGLYRVAIWANGEIGLWAVAVAVALFLPIGLWFDRQDKRRTHRL